MTRNLVTKVLYLQNLAEQIDRILPLTSLTIDELENVMKGEEGFYRHQIESAREVLGHLLASFEKLVEELSVMVGAEKGDTKLPSDEPSLSGYEDEQSERVPMPRPVDMPPRRIIPGEDDKTPRNEFSI